MTVILKTEIKFLEMKTTTSEIQNAPNGINAGQDIPRKISDTKDAAVESVQMKLGERKDSKE